MNIYEVLNLRKGDHVNFDNDVIPVDFFNYYTYLKTLPFLVVANVDNYNRVWVETLGGAHQWVPSLFLSSVPVERTSIKNHRIGTKCSSK